MVLTVHMATTWALVGLIWTIQVVHYPLFAKVGVEAFPEFHRCHTRWITWLVGPLMLAEVAGAGWLVWVGLRDAAFLLGLPLLILVWVSTALVQVPLHDRLAGGLDEEVVRRLVRSNWLRTLAWTLRAGLLVACGG